MIGHALVLQKGKHVLADQIVDLALADDAAPFQAVKGKGLVPVIDHRFVGIFRGIQALALALRNQLRNLIHASTLLLLQIAFCFVFSALL